MGFLWETLSLGPVATLRLGRAFQVAGRQRQPSPPFGQVAEGALCDPLLAPAGLPLPCGLSGAPSLSTHTRHSLGPPSTRHASHEPFLQEVGCREPPA